jgi:hypothetical protein
MHYTDPGRTPLSSILMNKEDYWYEEGAYAYKAGIELPKLDDHFPSQKMTTQEWQSLQCGWAAMQSEYFERMGQRRLF